MTLDEGLFAQFVNEIHDGRRPFPWQERLLRRVAGENGRPGSWPRTLALPTASGKTSCLDIAIFALALQSNREGARTAPRRVFFVVDRRTIVDEAFDHASRLAATLARAQSGTVAGEVAGRLRSMAGESEPLSCVRLRGGIYRDDAWVRSPLQPTIVVSTVDQIGSRMLFRGYGLRGGLPAPLHAAMVANDALIILDEAHCAVPFDQTMRAVEKYRQWAEVPLPSPFAFAVMTATPSAATSQDDVFGLDVSDREHEVLSRRLAVAKPARLVVAERAKGRDAVERLAAEIAERARALVNAERRVIGVMVNRIETAKAIHRRLNDGSADCELVIGRMRPIDRQAVEQALESIKVGSADRPVERPLFVVSTQCLEVGANLDFDGLVSECASLGALRQRFGRLNRIARGITAEGVIVVRADQGGEGAEPDPVYGPSLTSTWQWLANHAVENGDIDRQIDMGVDALDRLLASEPADTRDALLGTSPNAPVMLPSHVDCWVQTAPRPHADPDVALFLHGPGRATPDVQVCWREDLVDGAAHDGDWLDSVTAVPPSILECVAVPIHALRRWLRDGAGSAVADIEGAPVEVDEQADAASTPRRFLIWRGPDDDGTAVTTDAATIRPGDTIVLPASGGGWETLAYVPDAAVAAGIDVGDRANYESRGRAALRLDVSVLRRWHVTEGSPLMEAVASGEVPEDEPAFRDGLRQLAQDENLPDWLKSVSGVLARDRRLLITPRGPGGLIASASMRGRVTGEGVDFSDEDDSASGAVRVVPLEAHCRAVAEAAEALAGASGLPREIAADVRLAGLVHDAGKADPRFQVWLHAGDRVAAARSQTPLAKSPRVASTRRERSLAHEASGYPRGGRHELVSLRLVESLPDLAALSHDPDLVRHLVASHHGWCRPLAPVVDDPGVEVVSTVDGLALRAGSRTRLERLDSGVPERFWRLVRRYGWWGLAWLESMLRLADQRESANDRMETAETVQEGVA